MALTPGSKQTPEEKKSAQEDVLLREVDDAVRQDQYADFAKRFGRPLIGAVVLGLVAFGGYLYWDSRQEAAMEQDSETLVSALDQIESGNLATGSEILDPLIAEGANGATNFARMLKAGIAMEQDRPADAVAIYSEIAGDSSAPQALRDLASIREVATNYDSLEPEDVIARLKPLAVPGKPYFGSAGELVAMAYLDQGKRSEAGTLLGEIAKDETVPEVLRSRARQLAGLLGVDAIEDVDKLLEEISEPNGVPPPVAQ